MIIDVDIISAAIILIRSYTSNQQALRHFSKEYITDAEVQVSNS
jgi:hypothetical protein